jgi:Skp family chaperone for outer membrane proteins
MVIQQNQVLFNAEKNLDIDVEVLKRMNQQNI